MNELKRTWWHSLGLGPALRSLETERKQQTKRLKTQKKKPKTQRPAPTEGAIASVRARLARVLVRRPRDNNNKQTEKRV